DAEDGEGDADSRHHHDLSGQVLHLRDADAAGLLLLEEGREDSVGLEDAGPRFRWFRQQEADQGNRGTENEGSQLRHGRSRDEDDRRLRPFHGPAGGGVTVMQNKPGKRITAARKDVDRSKMYPVDEAVKLVKERAKAKFDETIEIAMNLGVDPKQTDQQVRGVVNLPNGTGRTMRVAVFAKGAKADEAKKAGADVVGAEDLVEQVNKGEINFDRCIATPDMMPLVGRLGKVLGPRGLMPNPKVGTVSNDVTAAVKAQKGGAVEFRVEKAGIIQAGVGKASFTADAIAQNVRALADAVAKSKPSGIKGTFIKRVAISSTMGPGVRIDPSSLSVKG